MWCVVGLGNPGAKYARHRHNIGFMAVDAIADYYQAGAFSDKFKGKVARAAIAGEDCLLLKPETFMNLSGQSVRAACDFYKIPLDHIVVLHDELALPIGKLRVKRGGGHNGHNGLKDIDAHMGKDYWRIRLGIDHPGDKDRVHGHVLSDFSKDEAHIVEDQLRHIAQHFAVFFSHSPDAFMSKLAAADTKETAAPARVNHQKKESHEG